MCNLKELGTNPKVPVYYRLEVKSDKKRMQFTLHMGLQYFCDVLPCHWVIGTQHFKTTCRSHHQGMKFLWTLSNSSWTFSNLEYETTTLSLNISPSVTWCNIPEIGALNCTARPQINFTKPVWMIMVSLW